jgi:Flp pilus assembly protein TadD
MDKDQHKRFELIMAHMDYETGIKHFYEEVQRGFNDHDLRACYAQILDHSAQTLTGVSRHFRRFRARAMYKKVLRKNPNQILALVGLGEYYLRSGHQKSLHYMKRALLVDETDMRVNSLAAEICVKKGEKKKARRYYQKAIETGEAHPTTVMNYILLLRKRGQEFTANQLVEHAEKRIGELPDSKQKIALEERFNKYFSKHIEL